MPVAAARPDNPSNAVSTDVEQVVGRLRRRFGVPATDAGAAVRAVTTALRGWQTARGEAAGPDEPDYIDDVIEPKAVPPEPAATDVIDALRAVGAWRDAVDASARALIEAARGAGATWEAIGMALGAPPRSARQSGYYRARTLGVDMEVPR